MQITPESDNSNSSKCGEGEQHDVPVISYSEDDQSFKESKLGEWVINKISSNHFLK